MGSAEASSPGPHDIFSSGGGGTAWGSLVLWREQFSSPRPLCRCLPEGPWLSRQKFQRLPSLLPAPSCRAHVLPRCPGPALEVLFTPARQVCGQGLGQEAGSGGNRLTLLCAEVLMTNHARLHDSGLAFTADSFFHLEEQLSFSKAH